MHLTKTNPLATELQSLPIRPCLGQGLWKVGLFIYKTGGGGVSIMQEGLGCIVKVKYKIPRPQNPETPYVHDVHVNKTSCFWIY